VSERSLLVPSISLYPFNVRVLCRSRVSGYPSAAYPAFAGIPACVRCECAAEFIRAETRHDEPRSERQRAYLCMYTSAGYSRLVVNNRRKENSYCLGYRHVSRGSRTDIILRVRCVARNLRSDQRSHGAAEIGRIDEERATLLFLTSRDERSGSALENFVKGALVAPSEGPSREEGASVPAHKSDAEGELFLSLSLSLSRDSFHEFTKARISFFLAFFSLSVP